MKLCGACILTNNAARLVEFYKVLLREEPDGDDTRTAFHGSQLAVYDPGKVNVVKDKNMSLMLTLNMTGLKIQ
jgi:hypothetical protein